jgi:hypothetical protein
LWSLEYGKELKEYIQVEDEKSGFKMKRWWFRMKSWGFTG